MRRKVSQSLKKLKEFIGKIGTLNLVLMAVGGYFVWFTGQMLDIYRTCGGIPETYAIAVVTATIGECGICGWIRTNKDRKREHQWEMEEKQAERLERLEKRKEVENG